MKKLSPSRLADTIARLRKEKNMTQAELSDATGINRALISRIEQQDFTPSIEQLENLGKALDFDITELFIKCNTQRLASPSPLNIAVAGTGYVGLSIATLLAQHNHVTAVDIIPEKVDMINKKQSPIQDDYIEKNALILQPHSMVRPHTRTLIMSLLQLQLTMIVRKTILTPQPLKLSSSLYSK